MKGLVLAGGSGTRLRPITHTSAKQLVPVANKPIMFYGLEAMVASGITDIGIIIGETGDEVRFACGDGSQFGATITYIPQDAPRGLGHCVVIARDFLGDDDFVMYLGDNLLEQDFGGFVHAFEAARHDHVAPSAQILLKRVSDPHRFGVASLDGNGNVVHLVEKPVDPPSDLALVGIYLFDKTIHEAVRSIAPSLRGELEITDAIQWLIDQGYRVRQETLEGWWIDTGKLTPLLEANRLLLEHIVPRVSGSVCPLSQIDGRVVVEHGAAIVRSTVRGPAIVGRGTQVIDSFVGPFSAIGDNCVVEHSEIEHSVIMEGSKILCIPRLEDSLIGRDVVVQRTEVKPRATRLMVGDNCQIDIE